MQKHTLKELADIGLNAACQFEPNSKFPLSFQNYREAFTKAVLDSIGYQLPKDEEREAFEKWLEANPSQSSNGDLFLAWKAGREELRKALNKPSYSMPPSYAGITLLGTKPNEPEWIPWNGGKCPLSDKVKRWEYKVQNGAPFMTEYKPSTYRWWHSDQPFHQEDNIIAYRVWE